MTVRQLFRIIVMLLERKIYAVKDHSPQMFWLIDNNTNTNCNGNNNNSHNNNTCHVLKVVLCALYIYIYRYI